MKVKGKHNMNVPNLRFREFQEEEKYDSYKKYFFEDIFLFSTGKNIKQNEASLEFETPCVRYGELYHLYNEVISKVVNKTNLDKSELRFSDGNEILLPSAGEDPLDIGSASALIVKNVAIGRTINILKPAQTDIYSPIYVSYYINQKLRKPISALAKGVSISNVYNSDLKTLKIILPSLSEQTKIANFLILLNSRIETQIQIIEELKLLKKALCQYLLKNETWKNHKISGIAEIGRGRVISTTEINNQTSPQYPVYSSQTSNEGIMGYLDNYDFEGEYITWTTDGANAGTVFYRNGKFNCTNVCGTIKLNTNNNPYFVAQSLQLETRKYVSINLANPKLMNNVMASIEIYLPEINLQNSISNLLQSIDVKLVIEKKLLSEYQKQKKYLLSQMFI